MPTFDIPNINVSINLSQNMMFFLTHIQVQVVATVFLFILEVTYFRRQKLPILSTRCFSTMMLCAALFMCSSICTVLVITYQASLPPLVIKMVQKLYVFSLASIMLWIYLYVSIVSDDQKRLGPGKTCLVIGLYVAAILVIIFGRLDVVKGNNKLYFSGKMITAVTAISGIFAAMTLVNSIKTVIKNSKGFFRSRQKYIIYTLAVWVGTFLVQLFFPNSMVSSIGVTAMVFIMYLGLESPGDYLDTDTSALNQHALKQVLQEYTSKKIEFYVINLDIQNYHNIYQQFGDEITHELLAEIADYMNFYYSREIFHAEENSLTMLVQKEKPIRCNREVNVDKILLSLEERMKKRWKIRDINILVSAHCDFVCFPSDIPTGLNITQMMQIIDDWHSYSEETGFIRRVNSKMIENRNRQTIILKMISDSIENNGIEMYYQPIYNIATGKFSNVESLVRLKDRTTIGFVSPEEFIPMAEKNGLIMKLSNRIFEQIFSFMERSQFTNMGVEHVEVNLSGVQSVDADLPDLMTNLLEKHKVNPECVNLEVTESTAITSGYMLHKNMDELKKIGCTFSMDDFGTGYSNLSQMAKVDYELIKIDKSLLWPVFDEKNPDRENAKIILDNMLTMVLKLGKKIVVEGVETQEQFEYLKNMGATYIQGYYFSKPLPEQEYIEFLKEKNKN